MIKIPLFVDIDNTVSDQMDRLKRINEENLYPIEEYANDPDWVLSDKVIPGSVEAIQSLSEDHEINWLSARKDNLLDATNHWLKDNKFVVNKVFLLKSLKEKINFLEQNQPSIFIDDLQYDFFSMHPKKATKIIKELKLKKIKFVRFEGDWGKTLKKIRELESCLKK